MVSARFNKNLKLKKLKMNVNDVMLRNFGHD